MIIVGGYFEVEPEQREEFIAARHDIIRSSRKEHGCLEYTFAPDPIDEGRVILFERWADQDALDAHLVALRAGAGPQTGDVQPRSTSVAVYDIAAERSMG